MSGTYDVIIVGTGLAGSSAALRCADRGKNVLLLEKSNRFGGTSRKSGGWMWIPDNRYMKAEGLQDNKDACIRYMASLSYQGVFDENAVNFGLSTAQYNMFAMYYDNATVALDYMIDNNHMSFQTANTFNPNDEFFAKKLFVEKQISPLNNRTLSLTPDYYASSQYNDMPFGRTVAPFMGFRIVFNLFSSWNPLTWVQITISIPILIAQILLFVELFMVEGFNLFFQLTSIITSKYIRNGTGGTLMGEINGKINSNSNITIQYEKDVTKVLYDTINNRVTGIELDGGEQILANDGVILANGGFAHNNTKKTDIHPYIFGSCAESSNVGDTFDMFDDFAVSDKPKFESDMGWYNQVAVENAIDLEGFVDYPIFFLQSDSALLVDKFGNRYVNERTNYHERGGKHFDPDRYLTFYIFDERSRINFRGLKGPGDPIPYNKESYVIEGTDISDLASKINDRLSTTKITDVINFQLDGNFAQNFANTIDKFNQYADNGFDADFKRGDNVEDHGWFLNPRADNDSFNKSMKALHPVGPYYCIIVGLGLLDTKSTLVTDTECRVLDGSDQPITGLYASGNVMAGWTGSAYWSGGSTLGPALTTGYVAGSNI